MTELQRILIAAHAKRCEDALAKAACADEQGKHDIANSLRALAAHESRQAFKVARPWGSPI